MSKYFHCLSTSPSSTVFRDLKQTGDAQRREARKIFLPNPRILCTLLAEPPQFTLPRWGIFYEAYLYFGYPVCFYFRWNSVDSSVSF